MTEIGSARRSLSHKELQGHWQWLELQNSRTAPADNFVADYPDNYKEVSITQSWLTQASAPLAWNRPNTIEQPLSHDQPGALRSFDGSRQEHESLLYTGIQEQQYDSGFVSFVYDLTRPAINSFAYPAYASSNSQVAHASGDAYPSPTPHAAHSQTSYSNEISSFQLESTDYPNYPGESVQEEQALSWPPFSEEVQSHIPPIKIGDKPKESSNQSPAALRLTWAICEVPAVRRHKSHPSTIPKRKSSSDSIAAHSSLVVEAPQKDLSELVDVFENAPGALANVKRRKKLESQVRKAAREVRKAGACHQCRFRKRTCSTGTPCASCLKHGHSLLEIRCQRETPFQGRLMHQYFAYSSTRRVLTFNLSNSPIFLATFPEEVVSVDGVNRVSHSLQLLARRIPLSTFSTDAQEIIRTTEDSKGNVPNPDDPENDPEIMILEDGESLGVKVEQWAVEYTSKFVHAKGPKFHSTTMAQILGTAYIKKGLPESALVATMLRVASIAFVLRRGVKWSSTNPQISQQFRTIQARIDTILYQRLQLLEKDLFQMLQRLIFRSAGCLTREQVYPVSLVLWQLLRYSCVASSHLKNIARKFQSNVAVPADSQSLTLKLVLSTHMALFRSSNPLLLDMNDRFNAKLLKDDKDLIGLALKMRNVVVALKERGCPELKWSIAYRKEYFDLFRRAYDTK